MSGKGLTIQELKEIIDPIAEKYQLEKVSLFGSFARGDYKKESDIDLCVEPGNIKGFFALCGFYTEIEEAIGRKVDVVTTGSLSDTFLEKIKKEEILLYRGEKRR